MGRYTGPKARVNRRLGSMVYETSGAIRASDRRNYPPGMFTRRGKMSNYGIALNEKQKIKHFYGLREKHLRRYYERATRMEGNTGEQLLLLCERRLDNVIRRAGYTFTRPQSRQGVAHCHFRLNDVKVSVPSILVRPNDVITIRRRPSLHNMYRDLVEQERPDPPTWIKFEPENLRCIVVGYPGPADISCPVDVALVIEFLSR